MVEKKPLHIDCNNCNTKTCCRKYEGVKIRAEEAQWVMLKYPRIKVIKKMVNGRLSDFLPFENNKCPFLDDKGLCKIYNNRFRTCYFYPINFQYLYDGKIIFNMTCDWVQDNFDKIMDIWARLDPPKDPLAEPDKRLFRLKLDIVCEIFGFQRDIPLGNKYAKEEVKIW